MTAPTAVLCGLGLDALWQWRYFPVAIGGCAQKADGWFTLTRPMGWVSVLLLIGGGVVATREYFVQWAALPTLYDKFDVGLSKGLLKQWVRQAEAEGAAAFPGHGRLPLAEEAVRQLQCENEILRQERDILKKP